jgi:hypothetical protein
MLSKQRAMRTCCDDGEIVELNLGAAWMKRVFLILSYLAGLLLVLTTLAHVAAFLGTMVPWAEHPGYFLPGLLLVSVPAILVSTRLTSYYPRKEQLKAALRGCPSWMKYLAQVVVWYAVLNFVVFMISGPKQPHGWNVETVRFFTGHFMAFFGWSFAALYSASTLWNRGFERRCPAGHEIRPQARFCDECGLPVP